MLTTVAKRTNATAPADVVRILDAVEHHDQRRIGRGGVHQGIAAELAPNRDYSVQELVEAAAREPLQRLRVDAFHGNAGGSRERYRLIDPPVSPWSNLHSPNTPGSKRFEHRVEAVDDHLSTFTAAANAVARS